MVIINITQARNDLFGVMDLALGNERVTITSKRDNVVLLSEEDMNSMLETLYILSDSETPQSEREVWHCPKKNTS